MPMIRRQPRWIAQAIRRRKLPRVLPLTVNETAFRKRVDQHQPVSGYSSRRLKPPLVSGQRFFVKLAATDFGLMSGGSLHVASLSSSGLRRWTPIAGWAICRRPSACSCSTISRPAPRVLKTSLRCAIATLWIWQSRQRKRATKVVADARAPLIFVRCRRTCYASRTLVMSSSVSMLMRAKATPCSTQVADVTGEVLRGYGCLSTAISTPQHWKA